MGIISDTFKPPSSAGAKKSGLWEELTDRLDGCFFAGMVDEFEAHLLAIDHQIPRPWREPLTDLIEAKREALAGEDVGQIVRENYDF